MTDRRWPAADANFGWRGSPTRCALTAVDRLLGALTLLGCRSLAIAKYWHRFWRLVSRYMPKRLYARSLIIIITPMILLQSVVAFVFMERHWQTVTQRLSEAVVRDIAASST